MRMIKIHSAEILCVGTEILIGDIVNTNAAYISGRLAALGIPQYYQSVVGDNPERLKTQIDEALKRCDLLIMTGGLGPTYDDLTKETAAQAMNRKLVFDERSFERMQRYFKNRNVEMSPNNRKQAMMPEGSVIFDNDNGTAPGCAIEDAERGKVVIMLPGPPKEMLPMFRDSAEPYLMQYSDCILYSRNLQICGMGESAVEQLLREMMENAKNPTIAPYCKEGEVRLRVTAKCSTKDEGEAACRKVIDEICRTEVGKYVYGIDVTLEEAVVGILKEKHLHAATVESCTGGLVAKRLTEVSGSSEVFDGGLVTYANRIKTQLAGVSPLTLEKYGAVSEQTAREMAVGALRAMDADLAVSTTGIAGPTGGTPEKPVGLIYVGLAVRKNGEVHTSALRLNLVGSREHNRNLTSNNALTLLLKAAKSF